MLLMAIVAATAACAVDDGGAASGSSSGGELALDFVGECEALFGCGCEYFLLVDVNPTDVDACVAIFEAEWAGLKARAAAAGLTADAACFQSTLPFASYGCKSDEELSAAVTTCSYCQHAHGSKGAGEPCTAYDERTSDCAQGLRCLPGKDPICEDPCGAAGEGQSCERIPCAEGLFCDEDTRLCMTRGDLGDTCTNNLECEVGSHCGHGENPFLCVESSALGEACDLIPCTEGLACNPEINACVTMSGLGEPCDLIPCAEDLACDPETSACGPKSGLGEPCDIPCADGLACNVETNVCVPASGLDEPCDLIPCADGLFCDPDTTVCVPVSGPGEPCGLVPCAEDLACDPETGVCGSKSGLGDPCDLIDCAEGSHCAEQGRFCLESATLGAPCDPIPCTDGLTCHPETFICVPVPDVGEPCDLISCADVLVCNSETILCAPMSGPGEPCGPIPCADGLLCDKSAICVHLPTAGEPCAVALYDQDGVCAIGHFCGDGDSGEKECIHQRPFICAGYY